MGGRALVVAVFVLTAVLPIATSAQPAPTPPVEREEIGIDAEEISYDQKADTVVARGNVVITRGDMVLHADEVRLHRSTNEAEAHGNVRLTTADGTAAADDLHLNLDEETGFLDRAQVDSARYQYSLGGERVEKGLGQSYHIENGRFTTCRCAEGKPSWSVSGRDLRVALGGYGTLTGGTFNVLDVPIMYIPHAIFPAQRERQSGFLMPRFGASNRRGFQTLLPFYWAIDKNHDATLAFDLETSARAGAVGEYRYTESRDTHGVFNGSYFNESFRGGALNAPPQDRWSVVGEHDQGLLADTHAYADMFLVSDDRFLREINTYAFEHSRDVAIRTRPFTESRIGAVQAWDRVALKGEGIYYQDLTGPDGHTLQRTPELDLWAQSLLGDHVLSQVNATAVNFQRARDVSGLRFDLEPAATVPLPLGRFAFGALRASVRETVYHLTNTTPTVSPATGLLPDDVPRNQSRELFQLSGEVGTTFDRVYALRWMGLEKLKHTVEPRLEYLYIPAVSQDDEPLFDGTDRINHRNLLTYGVTSRFIGKFSDTGAPNASTEQKKVGDRLPAADPVRELARVSLTQSVDISREIDPLQSGRPADHFSDIDFDGRVNPSRAFSVRFRTNYDTTTNNISAAKVGFFIEDPRYARPEGATPRLETRTSAGISYRFLTENLLQEVDDNIVLRLTDWAGFLYSSRYDVTANRFLDNYFGLRFLSTCQCWALDFAVTDRTNPQEVEVRAQLTLAGLGSSKQQSRVAAVPY